MQNHPDVFFHTGFLGGGGFFIVSHAQECEECTVKTDTGFHTGRHDLTLIVMVNVAQILTGEFAVLAQIPDAAVVDTLQFAPAEGEFDFDINCRFGIVGKFLMLIDPHTVFGEAQFLTVIFDPLFFPVLEPLHAALILAEKFHLHLGEFTAAESEVAGVDLVTEGFADLGDTKGQFLTGGDTDTVEVHKDRLTGFSTQISDMLIVKDRTYESFHHQIEFFRLGKIFGFAVGAGRGIFHLIHAVTGLAVFAVGHQVAELIEVTGSFPHGRVADDRGIKSLNIVPGLDHFTPPEILDGTFHT